MSTWVAGERKARYLAHAAQIAAMLGQREKARALLQDLDTESGVPESGVTAGQVLLARAVARNLVPVLPRVRVVEFPGLGHMAPVTHPEPINAEIARFLSEV